jgi:cytochrome d ubiquinol oxidase subunit II
VFLINETRRAGTPDLERYFVRRALGAALAAGALAVAGLIVLHRDARFVFDGLKGDALPFVIVSFVSGIAVLFLLQRGIQRGARVLAVVAVVAVIWAWGLAQHPYLLPQVLTIDAAAAPGSTLTAVLIVFGVALVVVVPALALLFTLVQRNLVEETERPAHDDGTAGIGHSAN